MSSIVRKFNAPRLSLVRSVAIRSPQVVSFEKLAATQLGIIESYIKQVGADGRCVGALVGHEEWDLRPLVVKSGQLTIIRFSEPLSSQSEQRILDLLNLGKKLSASNEIWSYLISGRTNTQVWFQRAFYPATMQDDLAALRLMTPAEKRKYCLEIAVVLGHLHRAGVVHGHITPNNIAWVGAAPNLLDFGFTQFSNYREAVSSLAPEIRRGEAATPAADIFGLGGVYAALTDPVETLPLADLINRMTAEDLRERPSLDEVAAFFEGKKRPAAAEPFTRGKAEPAKAPSEDQSERNNSFIFTLIFAAMLISFAFLNYLRPAVEDSGYENASYADLWHSHQPSMMQVTARAAIEENDRLAQALIIKDVLNGGRPERINTEVIKIVFDPRWEAELSDNDRKIALVLGTAGIFSNNLPKLPPLETAHPIVLLAIAGTMPVDVAVKDLNSIPVSRMIELPLPFKTAFVDFSKFFKISINNRSARALSHIVLGDINERIVEQFFREAKSEVDLFKGLRSIAGVLHQYENLDHHLYSVMLSRSKVFAQAYRWFDEEQFAEWHKVPRSQRIAIVAGAELPEKLSFVQYADLLKHPNPGTTKKAVARLNAEFFKDGNMAAISNFMSSEANKLTRYQTISLLAAFPLKGKAADDFYSKWFQTEPDIDSVLGVLLIRSNAERNDMFNFRAAQYLTDKSWTITEEKLKKLVIHPESLARALAYAKLNKNRAADLELLNTMAIAEPNPRLREEVRRKINE